MLCFRGEPDCGLIFHTVDFLPGAAHCWAGFARGRNCCLGLFLAYCFGVPDNRCP
jgi:hypothetical protein